MPHNKTTKRNKQPEKNQASELTDAHLERVRGGSARLAQVTQSQDNTDAPARIQPLGGLFSNWELID